MNIYKNISDYLLSIINRFDFKHRHVFNIDTIWQIDSLVANSAILFISIFSRFTKNFIETKNNQNETESFVKIKKIDDLNNWQMHDMIAPYESGMGFKTTIYNVMNIASRRGANSISVLSKSTEFGSQLESLGFLKIQKTWLCRLQPGNFPNVDYSTKNIIRKKLPSDEYNIFGLYTANKAQSSYIAHTLNFEQWKSLVVHFNIGFKEFVVEEHGILACWFRVKSDSKVVKLEILAYSNLNHRIIDSVFQVISSFKNRSIYVLISVDDIRTEDLVLEYGLQVATEYELSIKWLAKFVDNGKKINSRIVNIG